MKRRFKPASFFTYMILILLASTFILPLIWMLRSSLMGMKQIFRLPPGVDSESIRVEQLLRCAEATGFCPVL